MALHGIEKKHELRRVRILRDTRPMWEQARESLATFPALFGAYLLLIGCLYVFPGTFELVAVLGVGFLLFVSGQRPDIPLRLPKSQGEIDFNDRHPGTGKPQQARGIAFLGNRTSDNSEVWANADLLKTHFFIIGSTGAGKTEMLLSLAYNALVWCSGFSYVDGKGDVSLWAKIWSMVRAMGREDDLLVINYMTGNADTTKKSSSKLSNTYNPQMVGNAESNIQLLVGLMEAGGSSGDMWKGRAISFISSYMPALVELRDAGYLMLHVGVIREFMPFVKYLELMQNSNISERSRNLMQAFLMDVPGYKRDKGENQSSTFLDQYGYQQMQFTRVLSSLADTYGHIYSTPLGEINLKDVVTNRRILVVLLPALEKSRPELANLGKIILAGLKGMMGASLGNKLEGNKAELLDQRATTAPSPFLGIFDELGYYMPPEDTALMYAQARSLNFSLVAAGQDLQAFFRTSKEETMAVVSNSNIKIFGKLEDPTDTYDLVHKLAGEAYVSVVDGYEMVDDGSLSTGNYRSGQGAKIERVSRIELQDLQKQVEGEVHIMVKSEVIRARVFYAAPKLALAYRLNHFLRVAPPDPTRVRALKVDARGLYEALVQHPLGAQRPTDANFAYVGPVQELPEFQRYEQTRQGVERGIFLFARFDDGPPVTGVGGVAQGQASDASGGNGGGLAVVLPTSKPSNLASALASSAGSSTVASQTSPVTAEAAPTEVVFDGASVGAAALVTAQTVQAPPQHQALSAAWDIQLLAAAALPALAIALEIEEGVLPPVSMSTSEIQLLDGDDGAAVAAAVAGIASSLGADEAGSGQIGQAVLAAAQEGTLYPVPPQPSVGGKAEQMTEVLADLEKLVMQGRGEV